MTNHLKELIEAARDLCSHLEGVLDNHPYVIRVSRPAPTVRRVQAAILVIETMLEREAPTQD